MSSIRQDNIPLSKDNQQLNQTAKPFHEIYTVAMDVSEVTKQEQRTFLRERFLRLLSHLSGQEANISMQEKTDVSCVLGSVDIDIHHVQVSNLTTPMGNIPYAVLRMSDVLSIEVPNLNTENS